LNPASLSMSWFSSEWRQHPHDPHDQHAVFGACSTCRLLRAVLRRDRANRRKKAYQEGWRELAVNNSINLVKCSKYCCGGHGGGGGKKRLGHGTTKEHAHEKTRNVEHWAVVHIEYLHRWHVKSAKA
jgi:hypothetical protein